MLHSTQWWREPITFAHSAQRAPPGRLPPPITVTGNQNVTGSSARPQTLEPTFHGTSRSGTASRSSGNRVNSVLMTTCISMRREVGAEAEVGAVAEAEVRELLTSDVEPIRVGEHTRVTTAGGRRGHDRLPPRTVTPASSTSSIATHAIDVPDESGMKRTSSSTAAGTSAGSSRTFCNSSGSDEQAVDRLPDLRGSGLEPTDEDREPEVHELGLGEGIAFVPQHDERAEQVVGRHLAPLRDEIGEVLVPRVVRAEDLLDRTPGRRHERGRPAAEHVAVLVRDAQQLADHEDRERLREPADELGRRARTFDGVEQFVDVLLRSRAQQLDPPRGELAADQSPDACDRADPYRGSSHPAAGTRSCGRRPCRSSRPD